MSELFNIRLSDRDQECRKILEKHYGHPWSFADILRDLMEEKVRSVCVPLKPVNPITQLLDEADMELRKFLQWLNFEGFMPNPKTFTDAALKNWKARRKSYEPRELAEAFFNLTREPDGWQLKNNGFRPLSWWLQSDDRIESMKACHMKAGKGISILQL